MAEPSIDELLKAIEARELATARDVEIARRSNQYTDSVLDAAYSVLSANQNVLRLLRCLRESLVELKARQQTLASTLDTIGDAERANNAAWYACYKKLRELEVDPVDNYSASPF